MADTKWSQFPSQTPVNADEVVGLHSGDNARFSIANIIAAVRNGLANIFVPLTRTINGKGLSADIALDSSDITYDHTTSGASATNVQDALDEAFGDLDDKQDTITASGILMGDGAGGVSAAVAGTDYQAPLTAGTDYAIPAQLEGKANQSQLAYVETGTTATKTGGYNAGEYICWNGLLYTANTNIAYGTTLSAATGGNLTECVGGGLNTLRSAIGVTTSVSIHQQIGGYGFYILNITPPKTGAIPFACGLTSVYSWFKGSFGVITDDTNGSPGILITNLESSSKIFQGTLTVYWITL